MFSVSFQGFFKKNAAEKVFSQPCFRIEKQDLEPYIVRFLGNFSCFAGRSPFNTAIRIAQASHQQKRQNLPYCIFRRSLNRI